MSSERYIIASHKLRQFEHKLLPKDFNAICAVHQWISCFVGAPNSELGRTGDVCPFIRLGLTKHQGIYFVAWPSKVEEIHEAVQLVRELVSDFNSLPPIGHPERNFKALILVSSSCNSESEARLVEKLQLSLKSEIVGRGMMIGQFYPNCAEPGLHNAQFRPLQSPYPLLVLRYMQLADLPFLVEKQEYIARYCNKFQLTSPSILEQRLILSGISKLPKDWQKWVNSISWPIN